MTPLEFAKKYFDLEAFLSPLEMNEGESSGPGNVSEEGWRPLRVARYRLGTSSWPSQFWQDIAPHVRDPLTLTIKTIADETQDVTLSAETLRYHFHFPFVGKGSPE